MASFNSSQTVPSVIDYRHHEWCMVQHHPVVSRQWVVIQYAVVLLRELQIFRLVQSQRPMFNFAQVGKQRICTLKQPLFLYLNVFTHWDRRCTTYLHYSGRSTVMWCQPRQSIRKHHDSVSSIWIFPEVVVQQISVCLLSLSSLSLAGAHFRVAPRPWCRMKWRGALDG